MPEFNRAPAFVWWLTFCLVLASATAGFASLRINEIDADNSAGLKDEDGEFSDWIEIYNPESTAIPLEGYFLTDDAANLKKWKFPAVTLESGGYLVVFASGKDRANPAGKLHTNFQLSSDGEYLALIAPDGVTLVSGFAPAYPPQFENGSFGVGPSSVWSFFSSPTPGAANSTGTRAGPMIDIAKNPAQPAGGPLTITANLRAVNDPVAAVKLYYRRMFGSEVMLTMTDDGTGGDAAAGDGVWTTVIPAAAFGPGEMTRWRLVATDSQGTETKEPAFRSATDSPQYLGTVTQDPRIQSRLPVFHWFTEKFSGAGTQSGSRGSVYYDGEFYDNVLFSLHGQSTSGFPKKSYNIYFNHNNHFRWSTNAPRESGIDLLTNWADKSKVRQVLAYEVMREAGVAAHLAYTVRVQLNGSFFSTADFVERGNEDYLERAGLNRNGALYKVYSNTLNKNAGDTGNSGVEKKTREFENNNDLQALINGLALTGTNLINYLYDNIDIPRCVDMLAANSVIRNIDMHSKNWYIYRDTGRSGEWAILPWDLDLSHGRTWNSQNTYFDTGLYTDGYVVTGDAIRLVAGMFQNAGMRSMILRRIRTLTDQFLQPQPAPGTPENQLYYERRLNEQSALIDPPDIVPSDARRDLEKWGSWLEGGQTVPYTNPSPDVETMAEAMQRWKTEYLYGRRKYIYGTQIVGKGGQIPLPQTGTAYRYTPLLVTGAPAKAIVPADSALGLNWIGITSHEPYDDSSWLSGVTGAGYERANGYQSLIGLNISSQAQSNTSVYIRIEFDVTNLPAVDKLELRMKFDDGFLAFLNGTILASSNSPSSPQWNSAAVTEHEANPSAFDVFDITSKKSSLHTGKNILAIQGFNHSLTNRHMLILPELYVATIVPGSNAQPVITFGDYEVTPASGNQDQEFVQLLNTNSIAVDISDWRLAGGIQHKFTPGTVIPARGSLYLCPDSAAFRARTVSPKGGQGLFIQGGYKGHLSRRGETLALIDSTGATSSTLTFPGQPSDAQRYLVLSELMYHPPGDGLAEFIELENISTNVTLNMSGIRFTEGVEFDFTGSAVKSLAPGARAVVVRDLAAFNLAHGTNAPVAGVFTNNSALDNGGEHIKLEDADNETILEFTYNDSSPWPTNADGGGSSLVLIAPETHPDPDLPDNWRASLVPGGTPGAADDLTFPADPAGDANGNGQPELLDYAFGNTAGNPLILPAVTISAGGTGTVPLLHLTYPQSLTAGRAKIEILYSTDLAVWQDATAILDAGAPEPISSNRILVNWTVKPSMATTAYVFIRLRVTGE